MKKIINWFKNPSSDFVLFIVFVVLLNFVSHNAFLRFDLTQPKSYSLSKASKQVVKNLQEPLSVRVFFDKNLPSPYNSVAQYVNDLLSEYEGAANSNFKVFEMDLSKEANLQMASQYGLQQMQIQEIKNNEVGFKQVYMGVVITYGDSIKLLDGITSSDGFEYQLTSTISSMINTADTLASLKNDEKINITLYLSDSLKSTQISGCAELEEITRKAFYQANEQNKNRLNLDVIHPTEDQVAELVEKYGIQSIKFKGKNGGTQIAALGIVVEYGDNFRVLPVNIEPSLFGYFVSGTDVITESINENLQSLVSNVQTIGYITGHEELSLSDEQGAKNFNKMVSAHYSLQELNLKEADIPANMNCIVINGPKTDFDEAELYKVDQFVMRGGNVVFLIDPFIEDVSQAYYGGMPSYTPNELNIDNLLEKYGVKRNFDYVLDKQCYTTANQQYGKLEMNWAPILQKEQLEQKSPITKNLGYIIMLQNGSLDVSAARENKNLKTDVLVRSTDKAWTMSENIVLNPLMISMPPKENLSKYDLAVMVEGKFDSAFDKAPVSDSEKSGENDFVTDNHLTSSRVPGKIFVTGSSYLTTYQILDGNESMPISMFFMNILDYMNGNEDLCTMRTKGLSVNTLTIGSPALANLVKYFNQFGLVILVALVGFFVWRSRVKRRKLIRERYNPNDSRQVK